MRNVTADLLLASLLPLASSCGPSQPDTTEAVTVRVEADRAAVIGFLPPAMRDSRGQDGSAAQDAVSSAIAGIRTCLGEGYASYRVVLADRVVVRSREGEQTFELGTRVPLSGALFLKPGSNPRVLFAGGGPEALGALLRPAASGYFGKPCEAAGQASNPP